MAEQDDVLALRREPSKPVRAITIVRVVGAVDQRRPEDRQRRLDVALKRDFAREMHRPVKGGGGSGRRLRQRNRFVAVDCVGADVDDMRRVGSTDGADEGAGEAHVVDQHVDVLARRNRARGDDRVAVAQ